MFTGVLAHLFAVHSIVLNHLYGNYSENGILEYSWNTSANGVVTVFENNTVWTFDNSSANWTTGVIPNSAPEPTGVWNISNVENDTFAGIFIPSVTEIHQAKTTPDMDNTKQVVVPTLPTENPLISPNAGVNLDNTESENQSRSGSQDDNKSDLGNGNSDLSIGGDLNNAMASSTVTPTENPTNDDKKSEYHISCKDGTCVYDPQTTVLAKGDKDGTTTTPEQQETSNDNNAEKQTHSASSMENDNLSDSKDNAWITHPKSVSTVAPTKRPITTVAPTKRPITTVAPTKQPITTSINAQSENQGRGGPETDRSVEDTKDKMLDNEADSTIDPAKQKSSSAKDAISSNQKSIVAAVLLCVCAYIAACLFALFVLTDRGRTTWKRVKMTLKSSQQHDDTISLIPVTPCNSLDSIPIDSMELTNVTDYPPQFKNVNF